jgi:hypothetical protein
MGNNNNELPKVDRRGTSILVPIGIVVVFITLAALILMRNSPQGTPPPAKDQTAVKVPAPK